MFKKSVFCIIILILLLLTNPSWVGASGIGDSASLLASHTFETMTLLTDGSEMGHVAAGGSHTCALTSIGGVMCWGSGLDGELGNYHWEDIRIPSSVYGLANGISAIAAGGVQTCALTVNGGVKCWGSNATGTLGNNSWFSSSIPVDVVGLSSGVTAITAGYQHTCALTTAGGVKCWGRNNDGQLGNNLNTHSLIPVDVMGLTNGVIAIAAGGWHTCALTMAGGVKCWGNNGSGQLGHGNYSDGWSYIPVNVYGLTGGVIALAAGDLHTCGLTTSGGVKCWGGNYEGELGNNSYSNSFVPVNVYALSSGVSAIAAGGIHTCALTTTGGVKCWGVQVGNDPMIESSIPVGVYGLSNGVSAITAGGAHACAKTITEGIKCWGANTYGQLGNNSGVRSPIPVDIVATPIVKSILRADPNPTNIASVSFTVNFSKSVIGVNNDDFSLTTTSGISDSTVSGVSGSGSIYTVTVNTGSGDGTLRLDIVDNYSIFDTDSTPLGGPFAYDGDFTTGEIYTINKSSTFADVPLDYSVNSYIERLYNAGITGGCLLVPLMYCPENTVTRAQMAVFLLRGIHGSSYAPPAVGDSTGFVDVPTNHPVAAWIKQLAAEGITGGCSNGNYCPDATVTRAQMAVFLLRSKYTSAYTPPPANGDFIDVPLNHLMAAWIEQLAAEGITGGCGAGVFCPDGNVTRAQMAVFLVRTFNLP